MSNKWKNLSVGQKAFVSLLAFIVFIFIMSMIAPGTFGNSSSSKNVFTGDTGIVTFSDGTGDVAVLATREAWDAYYKAVMANDEYGQAQILLSGKLYLVKSGTKVLVIDQTLSLRQVRILEGMYQGRSGWTSDKFIAPSK